MPLLMTTTARLSTLRGAEDQGMTGFAGRHGGRQGLEAPNRQDGEQSQQQQREREKKKKQEEQHLSSDGSFRAGY